MTRRHTDTIGRIRVWIATLILPDGYSAAITNRTKPRRWWR